jgi:hypothetical protein
MMTMQKSKIALVALCLASLAALDSGCTPAQTKKSSTIVDTVKVVVAACDLGYVPTPPALFFASEQGCFGEVQCSEEARQAVATWVIDLVKWAREAQECIVVVKSQVDKLRDK